MPEGLKLVETNTHKGKNPLSKELSLTKSQDAQLRLDKLKLSDFYKSQLSSTPANGQYETPTKGRKLDDSDNAVIDESCRMIA